MAAAEYYNTGPSALNNGRHGSHTPVSPVSHSPDADSKPFPPTHAGYSDSPYNLQHNSIQSIDTAYNPHTFDGPLHSSNSFDTSGKHGGAFPDPYADNIPLHDTDKHQLPLSAAEAGMTGRPRRYDKGPKPFWARKQPWFCYIVSAVQIAVFIAEIVNNAILTKSPIEIKPSFNPMIGPSTNVLITMGARFTPCMKLVSDVANNPTVHYPCPNTTTTADQGCSLSDWCGFHGQNIPAFYGGSGGGTNPNQWWRFITPIFMHAGLIHIGFNMLLQLRLGVDMEREIGTMRFAVVYAMAGVFGNVFGGNFAPVGMASTGASGALFGVIALVLLDLIWTWKERPKPKKDLAFIMIDIIVTFALGLLPGLDNFCHIGGFLVGLTLGLTVLHSPPSIRARIGSADPPYTPVHPHNAYNNSTSGAPPTDAKSFLKNPTGFFQGRKGLWWAWWLVRAGMLTGVLVAMIVLINNFYKSTFECSWCKYLSCLPVSNWCELGRSLFTETSTNTTSNKARMLARGTGLEAVDLRAFL
ncbi:hypothetical protein RUND412_007952 [Rhizina undulata]